MKKTLRLCYIDGDPYTGFGRAFFTEKDPKEQWGDDWNDAPYEHNSGCPYENDYDAPDEKVVNGFYPKIDIQRVYFELDNYKAPCYGYTNSPYSVKDINNGIIAWIWNDNFKLFAGATMEEFIKTVQDNGGNIYLRVLKENEE